MPIPGSFRLYKIPLAHVMGTRERFVLHEAVLRLPCGTRPEGGHYHADSLWVLATGGFIKLPGPGDKPGQHPLCSFCSQQLHCASSNNFARPDTTDLPVVRALDLPRYAGDFTVGENVMILDTSKLLTAPFDDPEETP